jgi:hypothetical protein
MRSSLLALAPLGIALLASAPARAADDDNNDQTLLGPRTHHGGYGGPEMKATTMVGDPAIFVGGQAGWIIDRQLVLGGAGYGLASSHSPDAPLLRPEGPSRLQLGYGGFRVGWIVAPKQLVHFTASVLVGGGGVTVVTHDLAADRYGSHNSAAFFALEPAIDMEVNLARWLRLGVGASYRYLGNTGQPGLQAVDLSGPAAGVALRFGVF